MSGSNNKRSGGAAVKVVLTGFVLLTMAATGFSMFSGCGVDDGGAVASNPPPAVSSTESPQATPQPSPSENPITHLRPSPPRLLRPLRPLLIQTRKQPPASASAHP